MSDISIVFPSYIDLSESTKQKFMALNTTMYDDTPRKEAEIIRRVKDAEIIIGKHLGITPAVIDGAPRLRYVIVPAVGFQSVDYKYAAAKGIPVLNCPGYNAIAVAEHAVELMLTVRRKLLESTASLRSGEWTPSTFKGTEAYGKRLGLIGYGQIGKRIGDIAEGLGMKVSFINSSSSEEEQNEILQKSDVVCASLPLNTDTHHFLNMHRLSLLQEHCIVINVGRGSTVDQKALTSLLQSGRIAGAGLDVFEHEPRDSNPPEEIIALANMDNVIATPHIGYNTEETIERLGEVLLNNTDSCLVGKPINVINHLDAMSKK
jgi:phosphoglycerate dehydrogenase-like enzyme